MPSASKFSNKSSEITQSAFAVADADSVSSSSSFVSAELQPVPALVLELVLVESVVSVSPE